MPFSDGEEIILRGLPISKGIGIGFPIFFASTEDPVPDVEIGKKEIDGEIDRYRQALDRSRKDIELLQRLSLKEGPPEIVTILGTHLEMMHDPLLTNVIEERIRDLQRNTESIFHHIIEEYKLRFSTLQDHYFQERVRDIVDVSRRILGHLRPFDKVNLGEIPHNSIILTHELVPSETVEASPSLVSAFVTAAGGITSHAAIIARELGKSCIIGTKIATKVLKDGDVVEVDAQNGIIHIQK